MKHAITFTINVGTSACPNHCLICVSEMTGKYDFDTIDVNWTAFKRCVQIAVNYRSENVLLTGKGEPLLFPGQITKYLHILDKHRKYFTRFEMQTSGDGLEHCQKYLKAWKRLGLDLIALSAYHYDDKLNDEIFRPVAGHLSADGAILPSNKRMPLDGKIGIIQAAGFMVRLSFVLIRGYIDSVEEVKSALRFARERGVFQTTFRELGMPRDPKNAAVASFVQDHLLDTDQVQSIKEYFDTNGHACDKLPFGGTVYEINGHNACLTTCLDQCTNSEDLRNLIFFPDGTLATSWEYPRGSAVL